MSLIHTISNFFHRAPKLNKLGKSPAKRDPRNLKLARYMMPAALPPVPSIFDWSPAVMSAGGYPMYNNDVWGDCAIAGMAHRIQTWTANVGTIHTPTLAEVQAVYTAVSGFNPNDPSTDNGCVLLDVLKYWRDVGIGGHKIGAFVEVNPKNLDEFKAAMFLFGGLYGGVMLPVSAQKQDIWDLDTTPSGRPGTWGGHCIDFVGVSRPIWVSEDIRCITWGATKDMTSTFVQNYVDEAYAIISNDWINGTAQSPSGFNMATLISDLKLVGN